MKIWPKNGPFLHDKVRYEPGTEYEVDPVLGGYFVMSGWADTDQEVPGYEPPPAEVTLDVQNSGSAQPVQEG